MIWTRLVTAALSGCGAMVLLMGFFVIGPEVETRFFPVYSRWDIVSIRPHGADQSEVVFRYTKYRQCDPQGFAWYSGEVGATFRRLDVSVAPASGGGTPRPLGEQISSPYVIDATPAQIRRAVFAEIYNRCHPLWTTRSVIYP